MQVAILKDVEILIFKNKSATSKGFEEATEGDL
jgi:hypothetical protein